MKPRRTFQSVVKELITGLKNETIGLVTGRPDPPPPPDPDEVMKAVINKLEGKDTGKFQVEFENPLAADMLNTRGEEPGEHFAYIKAFPAKRGLHFQWGRKGFGFGECDIYFEDGRWKADTETMGPQFLHDLLAEWSQMIIIDESHWK